MPVQLPDFLHMKRAENKYEGISNLLPNILAGYKAAKEPAKMAEEQRKLELENQYYAPSKESDIELKKAQTIKALKDAKEGNMQGLAREWADALKLEEQLGPNHPNVIGLKRDLANRAKSAEILQTQRQLYTQLKPHSELTKEEQSHVASQWRALGIDPMRGLELYTKYNLSPERVMEMQMQNAISQAQGSGTQMNQGTFAAPQSMPQGQTNVAMPSPQTNNGPNITPNMNQAPINPYMTNSNIGDYNTLKANQAESGYLGTWVTEANAPYSQFPTAKDAWVSLTKRHDPEAQRERHEFLAAQMMGPETALLNIKLAQGSNAAMAIKDVESRLKLNAKNLGITVTPEDYRAATRIMHDVLDKAATIRGEALSGQINPSQMKSAIQNSHQNNDNPLGLVRKKK